MEIPERSILERLLTLDEREIALVYWACQGLTQKKIGKKLAIPSDLTVKGYFREIYKKHKLKIEGEGKGKKGRMCQTYSKAIEYLIKQPSDLNRWEEIKDKEKARLKASDELEEMVAREKEAIGQKVLKDEDDEDWDPHADEDWIKFGKLEQQEEEEKQEKVLSEPEKVLEEIKPPPFIDSSEVFEPEEETSTYTPTPVNTGSCTSIIIVFSIIFLFALLASMIFQIGH